MIKKKKSSDKDKWRAAEIKYIKNVKTTSVECHSNFLFY